jgi:dTDP-glucose pyrophosphorylase
MNQAVILAGGKGTRVRYKTKYGKVVKVMLPIDGKPNLERNIEILRDQLSIGSIIMVVSYGAEFIKGYFNNGSELGVEITYVHSDPDQGIADALMLVRDQVDQQFVVILGDEFYFDSNHQSLLQWQNKHSDAVVTFLRTTNPHEIANNYALEFDNDMQVQRLIEKPQKIDQNCLGLGTFILSEKIFSTIAQTPLNPLTNRRELVDAISVLARNKKVYAHELSGAYLNMNTIDDWHFARFLTNKLSFVSKKKSLVIPTYNERDSIAFVINDFKDVVDEIVVVDGGSTDGTVEEVTRLQSDFRIKLVQGAFKGYGDAIRNGVEAVSGDIVTVVEGDASFRSRDINKMFEYIKDCDMVIGTRTTRELICQGANMPVWLRVANILVAKFVELLWISKEPRFTDVGCTYRTFWKSSYDEIKSFFIGIGPEFSPEMMIEFTKNNKRVIEIPVSYYPRIGGSSKHSQSLWGISMTARRMLILTLKKRLARD